MKNFKIKLLTLASILTLISCEQKEYVTDDAEISGIEVKSSTEIKLENGNIIRIQEINDGQLQGTFIMEESDCQSCSTLNNLFEASQKDLNEQEIFWALSEPGTAIPKFLKAKEVNSGIKKSSVSQGWARNLTTDLPIGTSIVTRTVACNNSDFTSSIAGGFLGNPEFVALDKTPSNYAGFVNDCAGLPNSYCNKGTRYRLQAVMHNIKKWRGKICSKAIQSSTNDHYVNSTTGGLCQSPPCSSYVGPELYFEYYAGGKWKSMKNPNGLYPEGFEVPANSTKVYSYWWNTSVNTSFRLRVKNAMAKDQFDFMMDQPDPVINPGGGDGVTPEDFPQLPDYVQLSYGTLGMQNYRVEVDFTNMIDSKPTIKIPVQFMPVLPEYDGEVIFPNNFCGLRIRKPSRFIWLDNGGQVVNSFPYNYVPEDSSVEELFGFSVYADGIEFTGPVGACEEANENWHFPFPFTQTETVMNQPLHLVIELEQDSEIELLNYNVKPQEPLDVDELFEEVDFNELISYFNETFYEGFQQWIDAVCEENPSECPLED